MVGSEGSVTNSPEQSSKLRNRFSPEGKSMVRQSVTFDEGALQYSAMTSKYECLRNSGGKDEALAEYEHELRLQEDGERNHRERIAGIVAAIRLASDCNGIHMRKEAYLNVLEASVDLDDNNYNGVQLQSSTSLSAPIDTKIAEAEWRSPVDLERIVTPLRAPTIGQKAANYSGRNIYYHAKHQEKFDAATARNDGSAIEGRYPFKYTSRKPKALYNELTREKEVDCFSYRSTSGEDLSCLEKAGREGYMKKIF